MAKLSDDWYKLAQLMNIELSYYDIWGKKHFVSDETLLRLLYSIGINEEGDKEISEAYRQLIEKENSKVFVNRVLTKKDGELSLYLNIPFEHLRTNLEWEILSESGFSYANILRKEEAVYVEKQGHSGKARLLLKLSLPPLELGYHTSIIKFNGQTYTSPLIVAPVKCYVSDEFSKGSKEFGLSIQLYSLRSDKNLGIGDYCDLLALGERLADYKLRYVGLNPIYWLSTFDPGMISPYSPSTRLFLNPIYLDLEHLSSLSEFQNSRTASGLLERYSLAGKLAELRDNAYVDYEAVLKVKMELLRCLFHEFEKSELKSMSTRAKQFIKYRQRGNDILRYFATFEAISHFFKENYNLFNWAQWPQEYRDPSSSTVTKWQDEHMQEIQFFEYVCFLTEERFVSTREGLAGKGTQLYLDLPVGVNSYGFETWRWEELFARNANIGAPPDEFNPNGQEWGLAPVVPSRLVEQGYKNFIDTIRFSMEHSDMLRIDHVMGLMRLFWIPDTLEPGRGAYVRYPFEELVGILCLESHRNRCMVVGEDLGTVPELVREEMLRRDILSYSVFLFERDESRFKKPHEYKKGSVASITTHDLPTLKGFWEGRDIELKTRLSLFPTQSLKEKFIERRKNDKFLILDTLIEINLLPRDIDVEKLALTLTDEVAIAIHEFLINSSSFIVLFQPEDLIAELDQKNLPGTTYEYPNWRKKLTLDLDGLFRHDLFKRILKRILDLKK